MKWVLDWVVSSKSGVPLSNVSVRESPETAAETIGGADPDLVDGAGHDGDALPDVVHVSATGLGDAFEGLCEAPVAAGGALPQAQETANAIASVKTAGRMRLMLVEQSCG